MKLNLQIIARNIVNIVAWWHLAAFVIIMWIAVNSKAINVEMEFVIPEC